VSGLKYEKLIKCKPTWKIKHSNYSRVFSGWIEKSRNRTVLRELEYFISK